MKAVIFATRCSREENPPRRSTLGDRSEKRHSTWSSQLAGFAASYTAQRGCATSPGVVALEGPEEPLLATTSIAKSSAMVMSLSSRNETKLTESTLATCLA